MLRTPAQDQLRNQAARNALGLLARRLLQFYWLTCLGIITMGVVQLHPEWGEKVSFALRDPALSLERPFPTCAAAHYAGYFNIPRTSKAYLERQDEDKNGRSCEPFPGYPPDRTARLQLIERRLMAP